MHAHVASWEAAVSESTTSVPLIVYPVVQNEKLWKMCVDFVQASRLVLALRKNC